jgi:exosortase/archaeosortase
MEDQHQQAGIVQDSVVPEGRKYSTLGIVFAILSLIVLPIVFGPMGIVFGIIGVVKNDMKRGIWAIVLSVILATVSTLLAAYLLSRK